ncbi:hypothetical protein JXB02_05175 [Candidatus Woesearchaeota archaeon]|nr:hypothetical protein [Candidatus Woesearchaeota archaeon]
MRNLIIVAALILLAAASAQAFEITSPADQAYTTTDIQFEVTHNGTLDSISYSIDNGTLLDACENCSDYGAALVLAEGVHTIAAEGALGNESYSDDVAFTIDLPDEPQPVDFSFGIVSPVPGTYAPGDVEIDIEANETLDRIEYDIGDGWMQACEYCEGYEETLDLDESDYTLRARGTLDNVTKEALVQFTVEEEPTLTLTVASPKERTYGTTSVHFEFRTNMEADIGYELDGGYFDACEGCREFDDYATLAEGGHNLTVYAEAGNLTDVATVLFAVNVTPYHDDDDNETDGEPRFTVGLNRLPQAVGAGEYTDEELAEVIRSGALPPGVVNRLIKTGLLGNESIQAILDTQFNPPGIFRKVMGWFGFRTNTYAEQIYETYGLSDSAEQALLARDDLPRKYADRLKQQVKEKTQNRLRIQEHEPDEGETPVQQQARERDENRSGASAQAPGQQKRLQVGSQESGEGKVPPGQAKKLGEGGQGNAGKGNSGSNGNGNGKGR